MIFEKIHILTELQSFLNYMNDDFTFVFHLLTVAMNFNLKFLHESVQADQIMSNPADTGQIGKYNSFSLPSVI